MNDRIHRTFADDKMNSHEDEIMRHDEPANHGYNGSNAINAKDRLSTFNVGGPNPDSLPCECPVLESI